MDKYLDSTALQIKAMTKDQGEVMNGYDPFKVQVGGDHYKDFPIQPGEFINRNKLTWYEGNAVKYITRSRYKGKFLEDMEKAKHYIDLAIAEWKAGNVESK